MDPQRRSKRFAALLIVSIAALAFLSLGYFGIFGVIIPRTPPPGISAIKTTSITLATGRVCIWTETDASGIPAGPQPSLHWLPWYPRLPDLKRSIWGFDNHPLAGSKGVIRAYIFAFPIWLLALPFLIAPTIYFRRRWTNRPTSSGFTVVASKR